MTASSVLEKLQSWGLVTVIAILVWLYAEGEAVTQKAEQLQIQLVSPPGRQLAIEPQGPHEPDQPLLVWVTFRASTGQLAQVKELTDDGPIEIVVKDPQNGQGPEQVIILRDALMESPLGGLGINIIDTNPTTIAAWVEPLRTEMLDVTVQAGDVQFGEPPRVEPAKVPVTMPAHLTDLARNLKVIAPLDEVDLSQFEVNVERTVSVPLRLPLALDERWVTLGKETADVTFTIRKQTDSLTLTAVPIHLNAPPLLLRRFSIDLSEDHMVLRDVTVSGPADVIDRIRRKDVRIWAELRPSADELETGSESLPVYLNLPPAVTVESPLPRIPVQITARP